MMSMCIVATHHAVLGISILPDLATVRSCCNGLTVTLDRLRTLCVKEECVSAETFWRVVRGSPCHMMSMDIVATHHTVLGISILPDLATVRACCERINRYT